MRTTTRQLWTVLVTFDDGWSQEYREHTSKKTAVDFAVKVAEAYNGASVKVYPTP